MCSSYNDKGKRLSVLTEAEQFALYGLPDFDVGQQSEFLSMSAKELSLAISRPGLHAQIYCILQIGYFKAKHAFFSFSPKEVESDYDFVVRRYFRDAPLTDKTVSTHEYYTQRQMISTLFGYSLWSGSVTPRLDAQASQIVRRDVAPGFVAAELIRWLNDKRVVRPGYSTLQKIISKALSNERRRLATILSLALGTETRQALGDLLHKGDTLSGLAVLKQEAKDFRWRQMSAERKKHRLLAPLYREVQKLPCLLGISRQNLLYFASLVDFYTIYDLRNLKKEQAWLYLMCYIWLRYRQLSDNLVSAMMWHMKKTEDRCKDEARKKFEAEMLQKRQESSRVGRLLSLFVDDVIIDDTPFGDVRKQAWKIVPKDDLHNMAMRMRIKPASRMARRWEAIDTQVGHIRRHLRPLFSALEFSSVSKHCPWLSALAWIKEMFARKPGRAVLPASECPSATLPARLRAWLTVIDEGGNPEELNAGRYEFWLYRQIRKRLVSGEIYLDDSIQHRHLSDELVSVEEKGGILGQMDIPFLGKPIEQQLDELGTELHRQWMAFNREFKQGKLSHLVFDRETRRLSWRKTDRVSQSQCVTDFYSQLPFCELTDVFRCRKQAVRLFVSTHPLAAPVY